MYCSNCGDKRGSEDHQFCKSCGKQYSVPSTLGAVVKSQRDNAVAGMRVNSRPTVAVVAEVHNRSGPACPTCFSTIYFKKYTVWHVLIAIGSFPFGLLFFLAPVRVCDNGHRYGLGNWIIGIIQTILWLIILAFVFLCYAYYKSANPTS
jgi:hypothetical protein